MENEQKREENEEIGVDLTRSTTGGQGDTIADTNAPNPNENKDGKDKSTDRIGNISVGDTDPANSDVAHISD